MSSSCLSAFHVDVSSKNLDFLPTLSEILFLPLTFHPPHSLPYLSTVLTSFSSPLPSFITPGPLVNVHGLLLLYVSLISLTIGLLSAYISSLLPSFCTSAVSFSLSIQPLNLSFCLSLSVSLAPSIPFIHCRLILKSSTPPVLCLKLSFIRGAKSAPPF